MVVTMDSVPPASSKGIGRRQAVGGIGARVVLDRAAAELDRHVIRRAG